VKTLPWAENRQFISAGKDLENVDDIAINGIYRSIVHKAKM
jgi:hypothetical protein